MKALFPLLALTVLLASCARVEYDTGEVAHYPVLLCDLLRFLAFALLNAVLLVPFVAMPLGSIVLGIGAILDICGERALRLKEAPPLRAPSPIL